MAGMEWTHKGYEVVLLAFEKGDTVLDEVMYRDGWRIQICDGSLVLADFVQESRLSFDNVRQIANSFIEEMIEIDNATELPTPEWIKEGEE